MSDPFLPIFMGFWKKAKHSEMRHNDTFTAWRSTEKWQKSVFFSHVFIVCEYDINEVPFWR